MPRYFFDIHDRGFHRDTEGSECEDVEAARVLAMQTLPEIGRFAIPTDGETRPLWCWSAMRAARWSTRRP
uniref:DUF6894 family protein n=1 Tax=Methylobacterium sp. B34 TaxID=95563 RepID=UPI0035E3E715